MNKPRKAPSEYERKYNRSRLAQWLELPTWTAHEGVCLVCGIDPTGAEIQWDGFKNAQGVHIDEPRIEKGQLLTEDPDKSYTLTRNEYIDICSEEPSVNVWLSAEFFVLALPEMKGFEVEEERWATEKIFKPAWKRYVRNPEHAELNNRPPHEFIDWAVANDIDVRWLAWAQSRGFIEGTAKAATKIVSSESPTQSESVKITERREQEVAELRQEANKVAVKMKRDGIDNKFLTVIRVCEELLDKKFADGRPFASRWGTVDGMRSHLKSEHNPLKTKEFRSAKPNTRGEFNRYSK